MTPEPSPATSETPSPDASVLANITVSCTQETPCVFQTHTDQADFFAGALLVIAFLLAALVFTQLGRR